MYTVLGKKKKPATQTHDMEDPHTRTKKEMDKVLEDYFGLMGAALQLSRRKQEAPEDEEIQRRYKLTVALLQEKLSTLESYVLQLKFAQKQF